MQVLGKKLATVINYKRKARTTKSNLILLNKRSQLKPIPDTFEEFCRLIRIRSGNKIVQFELYSYQNKLSQLIDQNYGTVVVKSRQLGLTQLISAKFLYKATKNPAYVALVLSKGQEDTSLIAHRVREMINSLSDYIELENDNVKTIRIKNGGTIHFKNSNPDATRGVDSVSDILFDECGFVDNMDLIYTSAIPTLEMAGDEARIILLSTPNGVGNWYYDQVVANNEDKDAIQICQQIRRGEISPIQHWIDNAGWCKFFVHWKAHPKYSQNPNYIQDIATKKKLPIEKAYQEYDLAFTESSSGVFDFQLVNQCFSLDSYDRPNDDIDENASYYFGIDTAGAGKDYFVCVVLKKVWDNIEICYYYRNRTNTTPVNVSEVLRLIDKYKPRRVAIETNAGGQNYYDLLKSSAPSQEILGINTNGSSKPTMLERMKYLLESDNFRGVNDRIIKDEFLSYKITDEGKFTAPSGKHDDCVMATCLGCYGINL